MFRNSFVSGALLLACIVSLAPAEEPDGPWTTGPLVTQSDRFQFAIVADRTGGRRVGVFPRAVDKLNLLQPDFVMSVGDFIDGYTEDPAELEAQWNEFEAMVERLDMPFVHVPGNHDISNEVMAEQWRRRFGRPYYHFVVRDVLFLVMNTQDPPREGLGDEQIEYFADVLANNADVRWTLVFLHQPVWLGGSQKAQWDQFASLLDDRSYTVFTGHWHRYTLYERHGRKHFLLATTGGANPMYGKECGLFDHVVWVTMTDDGPIVANLSLDGILDEAVMTEDTWPLMKAASAKIAPVADATSGSALTLTNRSEYPLRFEGYFRPRGGAEVNPGFVETVVRAGETSQVPLAVALPESVEVVNVPASPLQARLEFDLPDRDNVVIRRQEMLYFGGGLACPKRDEAVVVDGQLDEWSDLPIEITEPALVYPQSNDRTGPEDSSLRFATAHDDEYVYLAIKATDDKLVFGEDVQPWQQDAIEIRLSAGPEPTWPDGNRPGRVKEDLLLVLVPGGDGREPVIHVGEGSPEGVQASCRVLDAHHYAAEVAIPVAAVAHLEGKPWSAFRLNVSQDDYDETAGGKGVNMWWRPDWRLAHNAHLAELGTFHRQDEE